MSIRWASAALAVLLVCPLAVADGRRSLDACTSFDQVDKSEIAVAFSIKNACTIPIDCAISWRVICAPQSKKRRAVHPGSVKFALAAASEHATEASAAVCGDDAFEITGVLWSCLPNPE